MSPFNTLLQREWMQHHRGWLILMLVLPAVFLLLLFSTFSHVDVGAMRPVELMLASSLAATLAVVGVTAVSIAIQTSGLARRDRQDRSIEFWLSLPTSHSASIGATLLMHLLLVPLLALAVGAVCSQVIAFALVTKVFGVAAWLDLPWGMLLVTGAAALLRLAVGVVLAVLWLSPLLLLAMVASAWLKRWGVPILAIVLAVGHGVLSAGYGFTGVGDTLHALTGNATLAVIHGEPMRANGDGSFAGTVAWLGDAPHWFLLDGMAALRDTLKPLFLGALAVSAACFGLLVLRRGRSG